MPHIIQGSIVEQVLLVHIIIQPIISLVEQHYYQMQNIMIYIIMEQLIMMQQHIQEENLVMPQKKSLHHQELPGMVLTRASLTIFVRGSGEGAVSAMVRLLGC